MLGNLIKLELFLCFLNSKLKLTASGFIMYTVGCMHIYLSTAISIERFYVIYNPYAIRKVSAKKTLIAILICFLLSIFWAVCPLFGWSRKLTSIKHINLFNFLFHEYKGYSLEGGLTSCSVEWAERSLNVQSYNITIWIFAYIVPLIIIIYCNVHMLIIVSRLFMLYFLVLNASFLLPLFIR